MTQTLSTSKRDFYKVATAGITGVAAFGTLTATGAFAGMAAGEHAAKLQAATPAPTQPVVVAQPRPHRTEVHTRIVHAASTGAVVAPAPGGAIRANRPVAAPQQGAPSTRITTSSAAPRSAPPVAPPVASKPRTVAPAPTSGS